MGNTEKSFSLEEIRDLMILAKGGDPKAQSMLQEIFKIDHVQEKSNFPTAINQQKQTFLLTAYDLIKDMYGEKYAQSFKILADNDAISWRGYKGFNYNGNVEMLKKGNDLSGILIPPSQQTPQQDKKNFWNRNKNKGEVLED